MRFHHIYFSPFQDLLPIVRPFLMANGLILLLLTQSACKSPENLGQLQADLSEELNVRLVGQDEVLTLTKIAEGEGGVVYQFRSRERDYVLKWPHPGQEGLFRAEVRLFTDPHIKKAMADALVPAELVTVEQINGRPVQIEALKKDFLSAAKMKADETKIFDEEAENLLKRWGVLADEHHILIRDLHDENILAIRDDAGRLKLRIIDGAAMTGSGKAKQDVLEECASYQWCRRGVTKLLHDQGAALPTSCRVRLQDIVFQP